MADAGFTHAAGAARWADVPGLWSRVDSWQQVWKQSSACCLVAWPEVRQLPGAAESGAGNEERPVLGRFGWPGTEFPGRRDRRDYVLCCVFQAHHHPSRSRIRDPIGAFEAGERSGRAATRRRGRGP